MKFLVYIASVTLIAGTAAFVGVPRAIAADETPAATNPCDSPNVNTAACKREKKAAAHAKSQGKLTTKGQAQYDANALKRCDAQPEGAARDSCKQRVMGKGNTTVSGSVEGGGKVMTNKVEVPADQPKN